MAVVDDLGHSDMDASQPSEDYGRQPPQDMAAEQSVLGGMMLSKDAIADVLERLRPGDFYRPAHQSVYDAILDLYGRGEPADAITVSAELDRRGPAQADRRSAVSAHPDLDGADGRQRRSTTPASSPRSRCCGASWRPARASCSTATRAPRAPTSREVVDRAQAEIYDVTDRRTSEDFVPLEQLLQPTMDEIDAIASQGGIARGVPTGFVELDEVTNGLHPGQMIVVAARPGVGKALALDTPLPTPDGLDHDGRGRGRRSSCIGADGSPTRVVAATEVMLGRPCYEVEFSDGTVIVADEEHQWPTESRHPHDGPVA